MRWRRRAICHKDGATREQLAAVAVAAREWALLNPAAWETAMYLTMRYRFDFAPFMTMRRSLVIEPLRSRRRKGRRAGARGCASRRWVWARSGFCAAITSF